MNVQILRGKVDLPPDDMEHFDLAQTELRRLDQHVRELLDYAKPLQLHREPVELAAPGPTTPPGPRPRSSTSAR
jgi:hypothetical protein